MFLEIGHDPNPKPKVVARPDSGTTPGPRPATAADPQANNTEERGEFEDFDASRRPLVDVTQGARKESFLPEISHKGSMQQDADMLVDF